MTGDRIGWQQSLATGRELIRAIAEINRRLPIVWQSQKRNASTFRNFFKHSRDAMPAGLPLRDCQPRATAEPGAPAAFAPPLFRWATSENVLWTNVLSP